MSDSHNGFVYNGQHFFNRSTNNGITQNGQLGHAMGPETRFTSNFATNRLEPQRNMHNNSNQHIETRFTSKFAMNCLEPEPQGNMQDNSNQHIEARLTSSSKFATNHLEPQGNTDSDSNQHLLANATHHELLRSGNNAYWDLFLRCQELEYIIYTAHELTTSLDIKKDSTSYVEQVKHWRTLYESTNSVQQYTSASPPPMLSQKLISDLSKPSSVDTLREKQLFLQALFPGASTETKLNQCQYPLVKFWTRSSWIAGSRTSYVEDEDGIVVSNSHIREIRQHIAQKFNEVKNYKPDLLAKSWTYTDMEFRQTFYRYLRNTFLEFALCDDDWKAKSMISIWYSDHFRKSQTGNVVKTEPTTSMGCMAKEGKGKRHQSVNDESTPPSKKPKSVHGGIPSLRNPLLDVMINHPSTHQSRETNIGAVTLSDNSVQKAGYGALENVQPYPNVPNSPPRVSDEISDISNTSHISAVSNDSSKPMSGDSHQPTSADISLNASVSSVTEQSQGYNTPATSIVANALLSFDTSAPVAPVQTGEGEPTENTQLREHSAEVASKKTTKRLPNRKKTVTSSKTAQNLCAKEWIKLPGHSGTVTEFNAYWEGLGADGQKHWDEIRKKAIADAKIERRGNGRKVVLKLGKGGTGSVDAEGGGNEQN